MIVLIVDDSKVCRMLYSKELSRGGYQTLEAVDGIEALAVIQETAVDLVVLDIEMPNMNGYEVCERLRSQEFTSRYQERDRMLPIVFVTSDQSIESRVRGFKSGGTDFITKGFKSGTLLKTVDRVLKPVNPLEGLKALVVDPSRFIRRAVTNILEKQGVLVTAVEDGQQAFDLMVTRGREVDLIIADANLPGIMGDALCRKIRRDLGFRGIPILILTNDGQREMLHGLFEAGMTDYLLKPFEQDELLARLRASVETIRGLEREIQERDKSETTSFSELEKAHAQATGMAEMASSVLHNIGNVLNSLQVSCFQLAEDLKKSKVPQLLLANQLIIQNRENLTEFLSSERGSLLPEYLDRCGKVVDAEYQSTVRDLKEITTKLNLMKDIIEVQQAHASGRTQLDRVAFSDILDEALAILDDTIARSGVKVARSQGSIRRVMAQRTTLSHIVINLIKNAIEAMREAETRILTLDIGFRDSRIYLSITDTGTGISGENLRKIFHHGFTTKVDGHGFGLSYCEKMVQEMGGKLEVSSPGEGQGATFTLLLAPA